MIRASDVREQRLLHADRPSRKRPLSPITEEYTKRPQCPRCRTVATGKPGRWWCGECSVPVRAS